MIECAALPFLEDMWVWSTRPVRAGSRWRTAATAVSSPMSPCTATLRPAPGLLEQSGQHAAWPLQPATERQPWDRPCPKVAKWLGMKLPLPPQIDGYMSKGEKAEIMGQFRDATGPVVIANVRVLTEGIDTPAADAVIFVDPKHSQIDIAQAVPR